MVLTHGFHDAPKMHYAKLTPTAPQLSANLNNCTPTSFGQPHIGSKVFLAIKVIAYVALAVKYIHILFSQGPSCALIGGLAMAIHSIPSVLNAVWRSFLWDLGLHTYFDPPSPYYY